MFDVPGVLRTRCVQVCAVRTAYPHEDQSFSFGFFSLRQVKVHLVTVKVGVVRGAHTLVEPKRPVRFDSGL